MKLSDLTKDQAVSVLNKVEKALAVKLTKSAIVAELASQKLCSVKSTGIEATLLKVAQKHGYIPPLFAKLMGEKPKVAEKAHDWVEKPKVASTGLKVDAESLPPVPQTQTSKAGPKKERRLESPAMTLSGVNLRAISIIEFTDNGSTVHMRDGTSIDALEISEETLKKNCTLIELGN